MSKSGPQSCVVDCITKIQKIYYIAKKNHIILNFIALIFNKIQLF